MYEVFFESRFRRMFRKLHPIDQERVRGMFGKLEENPTTPRPGADIVMMKEGRHIKYRLRVGDVRVVYFTQGGKVTLLDVFYRGRGY